MFQRSSQRSRIAKLGKNWSGKTWRNGSKVDEVACIGLEYTRQYLGKILAEDPSAPCEAALLSSTGIPDTLCVSFARLSASALPQEVAYDLVGQSVKAARDRTGSRADQGPTMAGAPVEAKEHMWSLQDWCWDPYNMLALASDPKGLAAAGKVSAPPGGPAAALPELGSAASLLLAEANPTAARGRGASVCQVDGCSADLSSLKEYHQR